MFERPWGVSTIQYSSSIVFLVLLSVPPHLREETSFLLFEHLDLRNLVSFLSLHNHQSSTVRTSTYTLHAYTLRLVHKW